MKIESIVLGNYTVNDGKISLIVAVTFNQEIAPDFAPHLNLKKVHRNGDIDDPVTVIGMVHKVQPNCMHFHLENLKPNSKYRYSILDIENFILDVKHAKGEGRNEDRAAEDIEFKTLPKPTSNHAVKLIFTGDQEAVEFFRTRLDIAIPWRDRRSTTARTYRNMIEQEPTLFIHLGDVFHGEGAIETLVNKPMEKRKDFFTGLQRDFCSTARDTTGKIITTRVLDDHDLGFNNTSSARFEELHGNKAVHNALDTFDAIMPTNSGPAGHGLYYKIVLSRNIEIWHLHNRIYDRRENGQAVDVLGQAQEDWLLNGLDDETGILNSTATIKIIVTPLPFVMGKKPSEDYRLINDLKTRNSNSDQWHRLVTAFADAKISAIVAADSHNYSHSILEVANTKGNLVRIPHYIVGILGGGPQKVKREEKELFDVKGGLPCALVPEPIDNSPTVRARVQSYYHGKSDRAYYTEDESAPMSRVHIGKRANGYLSMECDPKAGTITTEVHYTNPGKHRFKLFDRAQYGQADGQGSCRFFARRGNNQNNEAEEQYVLPRFEQR